MDFLIAIGALVFLMVVAYRGFSVIIFAPIAAMVGVLLTDPAAVPPAFTNIFMEKMVGFVKLYLPVFLLGAIFGKLIEMSGFSKSIVYWVIGQVGRERAILSIVLVCAILTYGGVSLFVVVFAVYPFAAEMFRLSNIPKRLIPGTIALGAFTFTMDALPGTPQIQNIIPTTFFKTNTWAAPWLGVVGGVFILIVGLSYLEWRRYRAQKRGEGYGEFQINEPEPIAKEALPNPLIAFLPLVVVGVMNRLITGWIPQFYPDSYTVDIDAYRSSYSGAGQAADRDLGGRGGLASRHRRRPPLRIQDGRRQIRRGDESAVAGALLASMNTASEYGFGAVIASLPGFLVIAEALRSIPNPLVNEAVTVTALAGITGSASGGMSIALATMANDFIKAANEAGIPMEVLHRVASMASGGMDTLPHNGAVITLLAVTGLTHRVSYGDIFAITCIKTLAVFVVIAFFYLTGIY